MSFSVKTSLFFLFWITVSLTASGGIGDLAPPSGGGSVLEHKTLTGDWFGAGAPLRDQGLSLSASATHFYQGLASGDGPHLWQSGSKVDLFFHADGSGFGTWPGFGLHSHLEFNSGQSASPAGGAVLPNNLALTFPGANAPLVDLSLYASQRIGDAVTVMFGKINAVDLYAAGREFSGGRGVDLFQHLQFTAPISGITPPMIFGGILSLKTDPAKYTLMVYDPVSATMQSGLPEPFAEGVTLNGSVEIATNFFDRSGKQIVSGAFGTQDGISLADPYLLLPTTPPPAKTENRWYSAYAFEQTVWRDGADPTKSAGFFGQAALSDGNPNPVQWSVLGGFSGTSPFPGRSLDRFGIAAFSVGYALGLKEGLQLFGLPARDESGAEVFYRMAVAPWLHVTADLQVVRPTLRERDNAVIAGLRTKVVF
jgi:porin